MATLRFLQLSDVHFGAPMTGGRLGLSAEVAAKRVQERRDAFVRAISLVRERNLDGVLIPGDLFDDESVDLDTLRFVAYTLSTIAPLPVFVAPGNHDPFGGSSPYRAEGQEAVHGFAWPANVQIFAHEELRMLRWPGHDDVQVSACGFVANVRDNTRRLGSRLERPQAAIDLLLFHGSRDDGNYLQSEKATMPFSNDELVAQQFTWTALGHYHSLQAISDGDQRPIGAYAGCLTAGGLDESGEKGCLIVSIENGNASFEFVRIDNRRIHQVECSLTGADFREKALERVSEALDHASVAGNDLVHLKLTGRYARGLDLSFLDELDTKAFHLRVDRSDLQPDIDFDRYPTLDSAKTTEERFVATLRSELGGDQSDLTRRALLYGLDALHRQRLDTRYEE